MHVDTCFATHHWYFAKDANNTLWSSAGGPQSGAVGWVNTKLFLETGDSARSQGWTPLVIDVNGKRDDYAGPNDPIDPKKDKRINAAFYGVTPSPVDNSVWGQSMDTGFSRMDQRGYLMRIAPGANPSETTLTEVYLPPDG